MLDVSSKCLGFIFMKVFREILPEITPISRLIYYDLRLVKISCNESRYKALSSRLHILFLKALASLRVSSTLRRQPYPCSILSLMDPKQAYDLLSFIHFRTLILDCLGYIPFADYTLVQAAISRETARSPPAPIYLLLLLPLLY